MDEKKSHPKCDKITFGINYHAQSFENYQQYVEKESPRLQNEHNQKFGEKLKLLEQSIH